jgi:hypothetical protein
VLRPLRLYNVFEGAGLCSVRNILNPDYGKDSATCPWDVFKSEMIVSPLES